MNKLNGYLLNVYVTLLCVITIGWVMNLQDYIGVLLVTQQVIAIVAGLAIGIAFLKHPYSERSAPVDLLLALVASGSWLWYALNFESWMLLLAYRTPDMWIPGILAIGLMMEALRKSGGIIIATLVICIVAYGFLGNHLPGVLRAEVFPPTKTVLYLYADSSGIPGIVLRIIINLVIPFILFGKMMEIAGGMTFFTNLAMRLLGRWRGGPAKGASFASAAFGMLSGSTVANILSTGIVTIPLMKKIGFKPHQAAAIEAVASNGGQIMPPVMGATAFIIAEFLQIPYSAVVFAAITPALLYYLVLFVKIDAIAACENIRGLSSEDLPKKEEVFRGSWVFVLPLLLMIVLMFVLGYDPGRSAVIVAGAILLAYAIRNRFRIKLADLWGVIKGTGSESIPVILIGAGAGAVIGVMNYSGFAFQLTLVLTHLASDYGLFAMLLMAALVSIVLGMGMPTVAVYVVLVTIVAPSVVDLGVDPLGAHLFLFYFGLMSMITPPIAMGSIVAAQVAGASMWTTGFYGLRLGISAYLLPFLWIYNPALLLDGSPVEIAIILVNCGAAVMLLRSSMLPSPLRGIPDWLFALLAVSLAIFCGGATVWFGTTSPLALASSILGLVPFLPGFRLSDLTSAPMSQTDLVTQDALSGARTNSKEKP